MNLLNQFCYFNCAFFGGPMWKSCECEFDIGVYLIDKTAYVLIIWATEKRDMELCNKHRSTAPIQDSAIWHRLRWVGFCCCCILYCFFCVLINRLTVWIMGQSVPISHNVSHGIHTPLIHIYEMNKEYKKRNHKNRFRLHTQIPTRVHIFQVNRHNLVCIDAGPCSKLALTFCM